MVGDAFWAYGTANKGLEYQQVAIKPGTNMDVLAWSRNVVVFLVTSWISLSTFVLWPFSCPLTTFSGLISPRPYPLALRSMNQCLVDREIFMICPESSCSLMAVSMPCHGTNSILQVSIEHHERCQTLSVLFQLVMIKVALEDCC